MKEGSDDFPGRSWDEGSHLSYYCQTRLLLIAYCSWQWTVVHVDMKKVDDL
jgi:hypothetical protein